MNIEKTLEKIGLEKKEIKIYLTLLEIGSAKANKIAQESRIERRTAYEILNRLKSKNIVSSVLKNGVQHFKATDPKKILQELKETQREYEEILPKLEELSNIPKEEIKIDILVGREGLRTIFNDIIRTKKELLNFGGFTRYDETDYILWSQLLRDLKRLKIKEKVIYTSDEKIIKIPTGKYKKLNIKYKIPTSAMIYGNKVAITIFGEKSYSIIRIENKDFSDSYRKYFEHYWNISKE